MLLLELTEKSFTLVLGSEVTKKIKQNYYFRARNEGEG